jgi:hypothetical protein
MSESVPCHQAVILSSALATRSFFSFSDMSAEARSNRVEIIFNTKSTLSSFGRPGSIVLMHWGIICVIMLPIIGMPVA